ncbi:hypothetical protein [Blastococcus colisei]|uniref:hypothetical protein n=1 Tax=Blastococcus colisei TaxID=1564162 RepID=UPI001154CB65|nr:hypothetical protein [Blastococcus colisei]
MFTLFDDGVREDLPPFDLNDMPVFAFGSTLAVAAQHEMDGDVLIQVAVEEPCDLLRTPELAAEGTLLLPTGQLHVYTSAWVDDDVLSVRPGNYAFLVHTSAGDEPEFVSVVLTRLSEAD